MSLHDLRLLCLLFAVASAVACSPGAEDETEVSTRLECPEVALAFSSLPSGFESTQNDAGGVRLVQSVAEGTATMWLEVGEKSDYGIELPDIVSAQKELFEALDEGTFYGSRQLMTPMGQGYYSRGRHAKDGVTVEETRVFLLHPTQNRLLTFHYSYPPGEDSAERVQELLYWVGEMESFDPAPAPVEDDSTE